jgi:H+-translocating NAD(P) transhydrogenase subunit alpha
MRTRIAVWLLLALLVGPAPLASAQTTPAPAAGPTIGAAPAPAPGGPPSQPVIAVPAAPEAKQVTTAAHQTEEPRFDLMSMLFVFMLSTFIGLQVISRVSRLLHTPLMSLTNAISAIAVVGAIIVTGAKHPPYITILGAIALFASMTNIVSGFLITDRMVKMFKKPEAKK